VAYLRKTDVNEENKGNSGPPGAIVLAINVCDTIIRDEMTHKVSLIGLFSTIWAGSFPCVHQRMHIYIALTGGHGKHKMDVRLADGADGTVAMGMQGCVEFTSPLQVVEVNLEWRRVKFQKPGNYIVEVLCDDAVIGQRKFNVQKSGPALSTEESEVA